jgi:excisionase family DNA binding protein
MSPKTYSTSEVAAKLGISRQTLYDWIDGGMIDAPEPITAGRASIRLWTDRHIRAACKVKGTLKRGPKPKRKSGKGAAR